MSTLGRFALRFYVPQFGAIVLLLLVILSLKLVADESLLKLEAGLQIGVLGVKVPLATWPAEKGTHTFSALFVSRASPAVRGCPCIRRRGYPVSSARNPELRTLNFEP